MSDMSVYISQAKIQIKMSEDWDYVAKLTLVWEC